MLQQHRFIHVVQLPAEAPGFSEGFRAATSKPWHTAPNASSSTV